MASNRQGLEFQPSTIETIDIAMYNFISGLNLHSSTNKGFVPTPIIWVGAERTFQVKNDLTLRDSEGLLKIPLITIERKEMSRDPSKAPLPANVPDYGLGGYIPVRRRIVQNKTNNFKSSHNTKKHGGNHDVGSDDAFRKTSREFPAKINPMFDTRPVSLKERVVYETVYIPVPVYVNVKYEVHIRTEYMQQMNQLLTPFISANSRLGRNSKYITLGHDNHFFEGFIDNSFTNDNNAAKLDEEERIFNSTISIDVLGYLIGGNDNENSNLAKSYENIVDVKVSRERVALSDKHDRANRSGTEPFYKE
tara:strand:+ start:805 stop:1725 length:921 start_codon:yes stop_codon:yes gene_type:complete